MFLFIFLFLGIEKSWKSHYFMKNDHFYQPPEAMKMLMPTCWADLASGVLVHHWYISGEGGSRRQCEGPCAPISFSLPAPRWRTKINFALSYINRFFDPNFFLQNLIKFRLFDTRKLILDA